MSIGGKEGRGLMGQLWLLYSICPAYTCPAARHLALFVFHTLTHPRTPSVVHVYNINTHRGGGGGSNCGGGGGAGGVLLKRNVALESGAFSVFVGAGGGPSAAAIRGMGNSGQNSAFDTFSAVGGGGGSGDTGVPGKDGGSGGGGELQQVVCLPYLLLVFLSLDRGICAQLICHSICATPFVHYCRRPFESKCWWEWCVWSGQRRWDVPYIYPWWWWWWGRRKGWGRCFITSWTWGRWPQLQHALFRHGWRSRMVWWWWWWWGVWRHLRQR